MDRLIIDGYNLLYAHPRYAVLLGHDVDAARARLIADLGVRAASGHRITVVFDAAENPAADGAPHHVGGVSVIFSPAGRSADSVIEDLAARSRERGERATIVTSDIDTRETVGSGTVTVLSSAVFGAELDADLREQAESTSTGPDRVPIEERIDPDVRAVLARWARGSD